MSKLIVTRRFDSSPEHVYDAWLNPKAVGQWLFATPGGVMKRCELEPQVGGKFVVNEQRGDMLAEHWGTFIELDRPRRIVFDFATSGEEKPTRVTVEIAPAPGGCDVTLSHDVAPQWEQFIDRARIGWTMILGGLSATVEAANEIVITRVVSAPRELVWQAWTTPEHLAQWWGPNGFRTTPETMDLRVGGAWTLTMHGPDGTDYPNRSTFVEVTPPARLAYDHGGGKPGDPEAIFRAIATFDDLGERTRVTLRSKFPTPADRDRVVREYHAREGGHQTLARMEEFLSKK